MKKTLSVDDMQAMLDASPLVRFMGVRVESVDAEKGAVVFTMSMRPEFERLPGTGHYHGGVIASFIDTTGDFAVAARVGGAVPTMNIRIDYLRPAGGAALRATARVRRLGRTIAIVDIDLEDDENRLVAIGRGTYGVQPG